MLLSFASCDAVTVEVIPQEKEDVITIEDGYLVVNGVKTEHEVKTEDKTEDKEDKADVITVLNGYLVVNGVKTTLRLMMFVTTCGIQ